MRRFIAGTCTALAALLSSASLAAAAAPPDRYVLFVRDSPTPTQLNFGVGGGAPFGDEEGYAAALTFATQQGGRITKTGDAMIFGADGSAMPEAYVAGTRVTCHETDSCDAMIGGSGSSLGTGGVVDANVVIIGLRGDGEAVLQEGSVGWHRVDVSAPLTLVNARQATAAGVSTVGTGAEVFASASGAAKSASSLAIAMPPCDIAPVGAGAAVLTLSGGVNTPTHACPGLDWPGVADIARAPTTWTASGVAAGMTRFGRARLAIFDLGAIESAL